MLDLNKPVEESAQPVSNDAAAWPPQVPEAALPSLGNVSRIRFDGNTSEYFGIWIVNILLTVVTLGLYGPWAKVRRLRYFYGHTDLAGERFDYTGLPRKILIGRLIALGVYVVISAVGVLVPVLGVLGGFLLFLLYPWLLRATFRFTARNSKYRNSRLRFNGSLPEAIRVYLGWSLLLVLSLGLLLPMWVHRHKSYQYNHLQAGQLPFRLHATAGDFYKTGGLPLFLLMGIWLLVVGGMIFAGVKTLTITAVAAKGFEPGTMMLGGLLMLIPIFYLLVPVLYRWVQARWFRLVWSQLSVGNSRFGCDLSSGRYIWVSIINWLGIAVSLGLLSPWAQIRMARLKAESIGLQWQDDPHVLMTLAQQDPSAVGEELGDLLDIDVSL